MKRKLAIIAGHAENGQSDSTRPAFSDARRDSMVGLHPISRDALNAVEESAKHGCCLCPQPQPDSTLHQSQPKTAGSAKTSPSLANRRFRAFEEPCRLLGRRPLEGTCSPGTTSCCSQSLR